MDPSTPISTSLVFSIGGVIASVASALAASKAKLTKMEKELEEDRSKTDSLKEELARYMSEENVKVALLETKQESHAKELAEVKSDIKVIMTNVQEIKEAVLVKKGKL